MEPPTCMPGTTRPRAHAVTCGGVSIHGWKISTRKGPIISDKDVDDFRQAVGHEVKSLPEMLFSSSRVTLLHEPSEVALDLTAVGALRAWHKEGLPPLQVKVAQEWKAARQHEIENQKAIQLLYDWTFTTPYTGDIVTHDIAERSIGAGDTGHYPGSTHTNVPGAGAHVQSAGNQGGVVGDGHTDGGDTNGTAAKVEVDGQQQQSGSEAQPSAAAAAALPTWQETTDQIDRALLMERDPILFFEEVPLFESDLDDNGVSQVTAKLRVMPKAWLLLLRFWLRVDGCIVRLRETRLFCRHDTPEGARVVIREQRHFEGTLAALRAAGAPGENTAYPDGDTAAQVFQAVAPIGSKLYALHKLELPGSAANIK